MLVKLAIDVSEADVGPIISSLVRIAGQGRREGDRCQEPSHEFAHEKRPIIDGFIKVLFLKQNWCPGVDQKSAYLASTTVTDQDELESGWGLVSHDGIFFIFAKIGRR